MILWTSDLFRQFFSISHILVIISISFDFGDIFYIFVFQAIVLRQPRCWWMVFWSTEAFLITINHHQLQWAIWKSIFSEPCVGWYQNICFSSYWSLKIGFFFIQRHLSNIAWKCCKHHYYQWPLRSQDFYHFLHMHTTLK